MRSIERRTFGDMVCEVAFRDLDAIRAEADRRLALLESNAPPQQLPACPSWMY